VTWDEPASPNGIIQEYIISYGKSRDYQRDEQTVTGNTTERVLDGLETFTTYFIKVRGKTSKMGNASKILNAITFEDSKYCVTATGEMLYLQSCFHFPMQINTPSNQSQSCFFLFHFYCSLKAAAINVAHILKWPLPYYPPKDTHACQKKNIFWTQCMGFCGG